MIALLLSCSISWCQSDATSLTGEIDSTSIDSVLVPIDAIKVANTKMIELIYEKEKNRVLENIVRTDSNIIDALYFNMVAGEVEAENKISRLKKERNISIGVGGSLLVLLIISLL